MASSASVPTYPSLLGLVGLFPDFQTAEQTTVFPAASWRQVVCQPYSPESVRFSEEDYTMSRKLGAEGRRRVRDFLDYPSGWGDGSHRAYSPASYHRLLQFLRQFTFPAGTTPCVFFTREGGFELEWKSSDGHTVQVEFGPTSIEVYHEGRGVDEVLPAGALDRLFDLLEV